MRDIAAAVRTGDWLTRERITVYAILLLIAYALNEVWVFSTAQGLLDSLGRPLGTDFANVWSSGKLVLLGRPEAALSPYDLRPFQQALFGMGAGLFYGWHYPPLFLGVAALLATLPYTLALVLWLASTGALQNHGEQR